MSDEFTIKLSEKDIKSLLYDDPYREPATNIRMNGVNYKIKSIDVDNNQVICTKE